MPARVRKKAREPKTRALLSLEANVKDVSHIHALGNRELASLAAGAKRLGTLFVKARKQGKKLGTEEYGPTIERFVKRVTDSAERVRTAHLWEAVMLVTCVEAYLQDLLSEAARIDSKLMGKSEQSAHYDDIIAADSLEALATDLRSRWARNWVSDGGPARWIDRLRSMGAKKIPKQIVSPLELLWGMRHVAVHNAGRATAEFVKRHPGVASSAGAKLRVSNEDIGRWVGVIAEFVDPADAYFLARYPALLGA